MKLAYKTPEGTHDCLFEECQALFKINNSLHDLFENRGYGAVITPTLEYYELYGALGGGFESDSLYKLTAADNKLLVLRPDSTAPIARMTAARLRNEKLPIRLHYSQKKFIVHDHYSGHNNEINQSGIELIGTAGLLADLEVLHAAMSALHLFSEGFTVELGHAGIFKTLMERLPVGSDMGEDIRYAVESKNLTALGELLDTLPPSKSIDALRLLPKLYGGAEVLDAAADALGEETIPYLDEIKKLVENLTAAAARYGGSINIDLGLVNRNDYYTGMVFRGFVAGSGETVISGGRYDNLLSSFGWPMPGAGFAVNNNALMPHVLKTSESSGAKPTKTLLVRPGAEYKALYLSENLTAEGYVCVLKEYNEADAAGANVIVVSEEDNTI